MEAYVQVLMPISIAIAVLSLCETPARTEGAPWCAYGVKSGGTNCGFYSWEQCMANLSGNAGYCARNPWYSATKDSRGHQRD
jgi:Protein of unknown function (DUF3551)